MYSRLTQETTMSIDKKLIGHVKQACLNAKKTGVEIGLIKLAGPFGIISPRGVPILPGRRQAYYANQQPAVAPAVASAPAPSSPYDQGPLPSEDTAASRAMYQPAPAGMQRFRHSQTGEVFYAPDQNAASAYVAGGDAGSLGIKPGQRVAPAAPAAPATQPVSPTAYRQHQEQQMAASRAKIPQGPSPMDKAIEEARKIRAQMAAAQTPKAAPSAPAPKPADRGIPFRPAPQFRSLTEGTVPLTAGSVGPSFGSNTDPYSINPRNLVSNAANNVVNAAGNVGVGIQNAASNAYDAAAFTAGNAADQGKRVTLDAINSPIAKAVGQATGGMGAGGFSYNRNAPGRPAAPPTNVLKNVTNAVIPSNAGSLAVPPARTSGGRNY